MRVRGHGAKVHRELKAGAPQIVKYCHVGQADPGVVAIMHVDVVAEPCHCQHRGRVIQSALVGRLTTLGSFRRLS